LRITIFVLKRLCPSAFGKALGMGWRRFVLALSCCLVLLEAATVAGAETRTAPEARKRVAKPKGVPPKLSLAQAVRITLQRNPIVGEALSRIRQREWQSQAVYSDFFPTASINYSGVWPRYLIGGGDLGPPDIVSRYSQFIGRSRLNLPGMDYPYRIDPYRRFTGTVTVTQPLYQGGKTCADYSFAKLDIGQSQLQFQVDQQDLILQVYQAYYSLMLSEKLLEVNRDSIAALERLKDLNVKFLRAGTVTKTDVLSTEGQLAQASVDRRFFLTDIETFKAALNNLLSNAPETPLEIMHDYQYTSNSYQIPAIYNVAMSNRDEIRQHTISIQQAIEATKSAAASLLPSVSLQGQGVRTNDDWNVLDQEGRNSWTLLGTLTWTFDLFRSNSTVKARREAIREQVLVRQKLVQDIWQQVKTAYVAMKRSEGDIGDFRRAVDARTENFRLFQKRYQEGDVSYTEVLIAQQNLVLSQADYYRSLINYRINLAVLERSMGTLRR
jgi:outer membrane protein